MAEVKRRRRAAAPGIAPTEPERDILDQYLYEVSTYPLLKGNEEIVPGKVFEYIGAGKPIIALAPEGAVVEVIHETESGRVARSDDVQAIADIVLDYYTAWKSGKLGLAQNRSAVLRYERKHVAQELARLLDEVSQGDVKPPR